MIARFIVIYYVMDRIIIKIADLESCIANSLKDDVNPDVEAPLMK